VRQSHRHRFKGKKFHIVGSVFALNFLFIIFHIFALIVWTKQFQPRFELGTKLVF
jgi:hypothetical protein